MKLKNVLLMSLSAVLAVVLTVAGTVAYFTSEDSDVNVMTTGNVAIRQNEQQRVEADGEFTSALEEYEQGKMLMPVTYPGDRTNDTVQIGDYSITLNDKAANYVDKIVSVTNTGSEDAYVRTLVAVPTGGADWEPAPVSANNCWLHWNFPSDTMTYWSLVSSNVPMIEINGESYYVWEFIHKEAVAADKTTYPAVCGFYLDQRVNNDDEGYFLDYGNGTVKRIEDVALGDKVEVLVLSQAIQAAGFDNASVALDEGFGDVTAENAAKWFGNIPRGKQVSNVAELTAAIEDGETEIYLLPGTYNMPAAAKGKTLTINGTKDAVIEVVPAGQGEANGQLDYSLDGSTVTFNGITIKTNSNLYAGYARLSATYNNCVIRNTYNLGVGNSEFNNCEFNLTNEYIRVGGAYNAAFNGCTFNTDGRAILVFQDGTSHNQTVTVKDCTFNATAAAYTWDNKHVSAVSIDGTYGTYEVNLEGTMTVDSDFNGLVQIKKGEANVTLNNSSTVK